MEKDLTQVVASIHNILADYLATKQKIVNAAPYKSLYQKHSLHLLHLRKKLAHYLNHIHLRLHKPGTKMVVQMGDKKYECNFCSLSNKEALKVMEAFAAAEGLEFKVLEISEIQSYIKAI